MSEPVPSSIAAHFRQLPHPRVGRSGRHADHRSMGCSTLQTAAEYCELIPGKNDFAFIDALGGETTVSGGAASASAHDTSPVTAPTGVSPWTTFAGESLADNGHLLSQGHLHHRDRGNGHRRQRDRRADWSREHGGANGDSGVW